jgi:HlyD family secretion protein
MSHPTSPIRSVLKKVANWLVFAGIVAGAYLGLHEYNKPIKQTLEGLTFVSAHIAPIKTSLKAPGRVESEEKTTIECQLERLSFMSEGRASMSSGASTILWVIDDGSYVKKGDLLCSINSSEYEEMVRQQQLKLDRARADLDKAKLDFETAQMGVSEFKDGIYNSNIKEYQGKLKLAESDVVRSRDRLAWSERMYKKGYASQDALATERQGLKRNELDVTKAKWTLDNFLKFGGPLEIKVLESRVEMQRADLIYYQMRYDRYIERFEYYKKMLGFCQIKAPHDGFVIYANKNPYLTATAPIVAGSQVRQGQQLFYLPDLKKMKVVTTLHESIVARVKPGMKVSAKIEGLSFKELHGHVVKIAPLPDSSMAWYSDTRSFYATIHLDEVAPGIRPEMSAAVEIDLDSHSQALSIPPEALAIEDGEDFCYVATNDGHLQRRAVKLGLSNPDLLEITEGLEDGDEVVADVTHIEDYAELVEKPATPATPHEPHTVAATSPPEVASKNGL